MTGENARLFFETASAPEGGDETGLLTAYFAPEYEARAMRDAEFSAPLLAPPPDLTRTQGPDGRALYRQRLPDGTIRDYPDRAAIETSHDPALVMAWLKPEDLFFLQIQGSGYLTFADGSTARAAYAADNGLRVPGHRPAHGRRGPAAPRRHLGRGHPALAGGQPGTRGGPGHAPEPALHLLPAGA